MFEFMTEGELKAWLGTRHHKESFLVACRATLRSLPHVMSVLGEDFDNDAIDHVVLAAFRVSFIACIASHANYAEVRRLNGALSGAVASADTVSRGMEREGPARRKAAAALKSLVSTIRADFFTSTAVISCVKSAIDAVAAAERADHAGQDALTAGRAALRSARLSACNDAILAEQLDRTASMQEPLWSHQDGTHATQDAWEWFKQTADPDAWGFWSQWYDALLSGAPQDWDALQTAALAVSEDAWAKGPVAVSRAIRASLTDERCPHEDASIDKSSELSPTSGLAVSSPASPQEILGGLVAQVSAALESALDLRPGGFGPERPEARMIKRAVTRHSTDAKWLGVQLETSRRAINSQLDAGTLRASDGLTSLTDAIGDALDALDELNGRHRRAPVAHAATGSPLFFSRNRRTGAKPATKP